MWNTNLQYQKGSVTCYTARHTFNLLKKTWHNRACEFASKIGSFNIFVLFFVGKREDVNLHPKTTDNTDRYTAASVQKKARKLDQIALHLRQPKSYLNINGVKVSFQ